MLGEGHSTAAAEGVQRCRGSESPDLAGRRGLGHQANDRSADGPVILAGHSWGGVVITEAGDYPQVAGLVYLTAYAPEVGESANDAGAAYGCTEGQKQIRVDNNKFAYVTPEGMLENIAEGLPMAEQTLAFAVQGQSYGPMFDEKITVAAWKGKPTWAVISTNDRMLQPSMEEAMTKRMNAKTTVVNTCHMVFLEDPEDVVMVLDQAAQQALPL